MATELITIRPETAPECATGQGWRLTTPVRRLARATGAPLVGLSLLVGSAWGADVRGQPAKGQFKVVVFDEAFLSQRDRPYVDQILEKMGKSRSR